MSFNSIRIRSKRERSEEEVDRIAKKLHMIKTPNSGATNWSGSKADLVSKEDRLEHKYTDSKSYSITIEDLIKLFKYSNSDEPKTPLFCITFNVMPFDCPKDWVLMPLSEYEGLKDGKCSCCK